MSTRRAGVTDMAVEAVELPGAHMYLAESPRPLVELMAARCARG
ncbi:hypothetical protein ACWCRD_20255 [Streptomyces sp. NPDC002092]